VISHEEWDFLAEYAPLVTLMAVIGAYMGADGAHASGFMAVFVFGMVIGNKEIFGFRMEEHETERLEEYVATTALIMRMFIFLLLGAQVDFALMNQYWWVASWWLLVMMFVARPLTVFLCAGPDPPRQMEQGGNAVHVLDPGNRRHPGGPGRPADGHEGARRADDRLGYLRGRADDHPDPGAHDKMAGAQARASGRVTRTAA